MSRIGRAPIPVPSNVTVDIQPGHVSVKGPKGQLSRSIPAEMTVQVDGGNIVVTRPTDSSKHRSLHGLTRTLVANMVAGVSVGFEKKIEIYGVGYRAQWQNDRLNMQLGFSHPLDLVPPAGVTVQNVESFTPTSANEWLSSKFTISGADKEQVGQFAAIVKSYRPVEPYKGKGIKYAGERVRRKAGKAGAKGKGK